METEGSSPWSEHPVTCLNPEPDTFSTHLPHRSSFSYPVFFRNLVNSFPRWGRRVHVLQAVASPIKEGSTETKVRELLMARVFLQQDVIMYAFIVKGIVIASAIIRLLGGRSVYFWHCSLCLWRLKNRRPIFTATGSLNPCQVGTRIFFSDNFL